MLCPKCGREYEGSECPYCSGPKILVNDSDYQKRRMAYEKKQAGVKSASSDNQKNTGDFDPSELVERIKKSSNKGKKYIEEKTDKLQKSVKDKKKPFEYSVRKASEGDLPDSNHGIKKLLIKHKRKVIASFILLLVVILCGIGIYQLVIRKNYVLYMSSNGKIYNVAGLENQLVAETSDAIFDEKRKLFYTPSYPDEINRSQVTETMASDNGKYFACETYDPDSSLATLYIWNDNNCTKVIENKMEKSIKYISDKGKIIFTDSNVINDKGAVTGVDYYYFDIAGNKNAQNDKGSLTEIAKNMKAVHYYSDKNELIYIDSSNQLILYSLKDLSKKTLDVGVSNLYCMSSEMNGVYSSRIDFVNDTKNLDDFFYSTEGGCYYYDISDNNTMYVGKETTSETQFISFSSTQIYQLQLGKVYYTAVNNGKTVGLKQIDTLGSAFSFIAMSQNGSVLFVNDQGELIMSNKGSIKTLVESITDGSLAKVENSQEGFTYAKDSMQYYQKSLSAKPVAMNGVSEQINSDQSDQVNKDKNLRQVIFYKNKLYFYDANGKLHSCTTKGNDNNLIGDVDQFWLGTELK